MVTPLVTVIGGEAIGMRLIIPPAYVIGVQRAIQVGFLSDPK